MGMGLLSLTGREQSISLPTSLQASQKALMIVMFDCDIILVHILSRIPGSNYWMVCLCWYAHKLWPVAAQGGYVWEWQNAWALKIMMRLGGKGRKANAREGVGYEKIAMLPLHLKVSPEGWNPVPCANHLVIAAEEIELGGSTRA
jgi:hypothetical protein